MSADLVEWLRNLSDNWDDIVLDVEEDDHNGDDDEAFGDTGTARCLEAAMRIETLQAALAKAEAEITRHHRDFARWEEMADKGARASAQLVGLREQLARQAPRHPWGEPLFDGALERASECEMCWASDGDTRCIRCGRSCGGYDACECPDGVLVGPCATARQIRAEVTG